MFIEMELNSGWIVTYNTREKLRREMKVSNDHVGEENAEEKHPFVRI